MEVICLEDAAFYVLVETVIQRIREHNTVSEDRWLTSEEAMHLLKIKSKSTLQNLRDTGSIRYSQPHKKHIVYDRQSLLEYLNKHAKDTF